MCVLRYLLYIWTNTFTKRRVQQDWIVSTLCFHYLDRAVVSSTQSIWLCILLYPSFHCGYNANPIISCVRDVSQKYSLCFDTECFCILLHLNAVWLFNILQRYPYYISYQHCTSRYHTLLFFCLVFIPDLLCTKASSNSTCVS